jgi:uncharacterized membrane protein YcaP (DUF421 family)
MLQSYLVQALFALLYYFVLILILRLAGKRLAGQTTTFDLVVNIQMAVVLQTTLLKEGLANALVFLATVFMTHLSVSRASARWPRLRAVIRGAPRPLVRGGVVIEQALADERVTREDLLAGLRKLGFDAPEQVELAVLEETGHISAVPLEKKTA